MPNVLFVDDDPSILRVNRVYFESRGYGVFTAQNRAQAEDALVKAQIDCIVLDILMPDTDGWALCRDFKSRAATPILFLTSLTEQECLYRGFELGGDDYLTKPYELKELELRVKARIRASSGEVRRELLSYPPLTLDAVGRRVTVDDRAVPLTAYEFDILLLLARHPGQVFSMEEIYRQIWNLPDLGSAQTVRVHLARMRRKLEDACGGVKLIQVVWGKGFLFSPAK